MWFLKCTVADYLQDVGIWSNLATLFTKNRTNSTGRVKMQTSELKEIYTYQTEPIKQ